MRPDEYGGRNGRTKVNARSMKMVERLYRRQEPIHILKPPGAYTLKFAKIFVDVVLVFPCLPL